MRIWTIQPLAVLEQVEKDGVALSYGGLSDWDDYVWEPYEWLIGQLVQRRGWTPRRFPWWAYCEKPDLRNHRWSGRGMQVRLELEIDENRLLVMPRWAWDNVVSGQYIAYTEEEDRAWNERMLANVPLESYGDPDSRDPLRPLPDPWNTELHTSWERLFAPGLPPESPKRPGPWESGSGKKRECVWEEIRRDDIRRVTRFEGKTTLWLQRLMSRNRV